MGCMGLRPLDLDAPVCAGKYNPGGSSPAKFKGLSCSLGICHQCGKAGAELDSKGLYYCDPSNKDCLSQRPSSRTFWHLTFPEVRRETEGQRRGKWGKKQESNPLYSLKCTSMMLLNLPKQSSYFDLVVAGRQGPQRCLSLNTAMELCGIKNGCYAVMDMITQIHWFVHLCGHLANW